MLFAEFRGKMYFNKMTEKLHGPEREKSFERILNSAAESIPSEKHPERNEDAIINRLDLGLFAVFDGMGGHEAGEKASSVVRDYITGFFERLAQENTEDVRKQGWKNLLERALREAGEELKKLRQGYGRKAPDTTATVVKFIEDNGKRCLVYAHVGDSRLYIKYADELFLEQISDDDDILKYEKPDLPKGQREIFESMLSNAKNQEDLLKETPNGSPLYHYFERRNQISRSMGNISEKEGAEDMQSGVLDIQSGDIVLLTSDGIHDNLTFDEIAGTAKIYPSPEKLVKTLVEKAKERSGMGKEVNIRSKPDDMSAVAVEITG